MWTANVDDHTWKTRTFTVFHCRGAEIRVEGRARKASTHALISRDSLTELE